jgi:hypothetical protein
MSRTCFSWSAIWFCVGNRRQKASTSYHHIRRAPIWSRRSLGLHLIGCVILTELTFLTHGTLTSLGISTLDALLNKDMYSFYVISIQYKYSSCVLLRPYCVSRILLYFSKRFADQFFLLLEFLRAGTVSNSSHTCTRSALYVLGGRQWLSGETGNLMHARALRLMLRIVG